MMSSLKKILQISALTGVIMIATFSYSIIATSHISASSAPPVYTPCNAGAGALPTSVFVPWYEYLDCDDSGAPHITSWDKAAPLIGMAVLEMLTRIAGLVAVGFIVWGGIQYTLSQGEPEGMKNAKSTIMNAIVGLVIALLAIGIVQFIAGLLR